MKYLVLAVLLLTASCKEEQFNNQYNLPEDDKIEVVAVEDEVVEVVEEEKLRTFSLETPLFLRAYSYKAIQKFDFNGAESKCTFYYSDSNFDRVIKEDLLVTSEEFSYSSAYKEVQYSLNFKSNSNSVTKLRCAFKNSEEYFYNKDMYSTFNSLFKEKKLFQTESHLFDY